VTAAGVAEALRVGPGGLLREGSGWRGRIHHELHPARLGRRARAGDPSQPEEGDQRGRASVAVDSVVAPGDASHEGKTLDINMMERTEEEFRDLFAWAGLHLVRAIPTN
jgi:hypothetical protein